MRIIDRNNKRTFAISIHPIQNVSFKVNTLLMTGNKIETFESFYYERIRGTNLVWKMMSIDNDIEKYYYNVR